MQADPPKVVRCPPELVPEALSLVLTEVPPSLRGEIAASVIDAAADVFSEPLFITTRGGELCAAAWGQRQPGNIAVFWPPRYVAIDVDDTTCRLVDAVVLDLDGLGVELTQVLVNSSESRLVPILNQAGFRRLAELLYMTCEAPRFPRERHTTGELSYVAYNDSQRAILVQLIERSYDGTLDCVGLNGIRDVDNVVTGYQATGSYRTENWLIVRAGGTDVGILLLADHPNAGHWELMYMGLVPEARGHGWGRQIAQHAQWLARRAGVERIVLAVDSGNEPALRMYRGTGFELWDRRTVYVRFLRESRG